MDPRFCQLGFPGYALDRSDAVGNPAAVLSSEADGSDPRIRPAVDGIRSARKRVSELVADRSGVLLVRGGGHSARHSDGQFPLVV